MKPMAIVHRLKRRVRLLTAQKRRLVWELRAAKPIPGKSPPSHRRKEPLLLPE